MGARGYEQAGAAGYNDFARARNVSGDGRQSAGAGFDEPDGQAFPPGGEDEGVCGVEPWLDVMLEAEEAHAALDTQVCRQLAQAAVLRSFAGDEEPGVLRLQCEGVQERGVVFDRLKTASGQPEEFVVEAKLAADSGAVAGVGLEMLDVDSVMKNGEFAVVNHARRAVRIGNGLADGGDAVGEPAACTVAEAADAASGRGTVERVNEDGCRRSEIG